MKDCFDCRFFESPQQRDGSIGYRCNKHKTEIDDALVLLGWFACDDWKSFVIPACPGCGGKLVEIDHFLFGPCLMCYNKSCEMYLEKQEFE